MFLWYLKICSVNAKILSEDIMWFMLFGFKPTSQAINKDFIVSNRIRHNARCLFFLDHLNHNTTETLICIKITRSIISSISN